MSINCSEFENVTIAFDYFNMLKPIGEELIKYLRAYRQLAEEFNKKLEIFENSFGDKLSNPHDNPKIAQIIELTRKVTGIIFQNVELFQFSIEEMDKKVMNFEEELKVKSELINNLKKNSLELGKDLTSSYNEVKRTKNTYMNSLSKTEETIDKYYIGKNRIQEHESGLGEKLNDNDYKLLKESQKSQINEMETSIKLSKKYEDFHKGAISACKKIQENYKKDCNSLVEEIKKITCQLANDIKDMVCSFMLAYKNIYKQPLSFIDININKLNSIEEEKEMDKIISSNLKNDNELKYITPTKYHLKSFSFLKHSNYLINPDEEKKKEDNIKHKVININALDRKSIETLEDGFDEMMYICDESLIMTIKSLFDNFDLIEKEDFNIDVEEGKNRAQKYILKILTNMNAYPFAKEDFHCNNPELAQQSNIEYQREELKNEELIDLINLLDIHENRIIFLNKLNNYRGRGKFALCNKDYILLSQLFNIITDKIEKDLDYHSAQMVIVLSETYFIIDGKGKKYLQESFKENKLFKDKNFWEGFLCYSINKEIIKTLKRDEKIREDKEVSDYKYANIVFSQILTLIDNMFEFELDPKIIKEILIPKIIAYKLNDEFKETINDIIEVKKNQQNK